MKFEDDPRFKGYTGVEEVEDEETEEVRKAKPPEIKVYLDQDGTGTLLQNAALTRRAFIRAILDRRFGTNGISSIAEIAQMMEAHYVTVINDFYEIQAVKVRADFRKKTYRWWMLPPISSSKMEKMRGNQAEVERTLSRRLITDGISTFVVKNSVYINASPGTAKGLKHWFSMLIWPGLLGVMSDDDTCWLICASDEDAHTIHYRVTGYVEGIRNA